MNNVLVVGNSFIGNALYSKQKNYTIINHNDINSVDYSKFDVVINTALNPVYRNESYNIKNDIDIEIAKKACKAGCYYIMLSSRKVYGNFKNVEKLTEAHPYNPFDYYSENKIKTEQFLINNFNENSCIVRGSNFFGFELFRNSFFGFCLTSLFENNLIKCSINENIIRDFIHIDDVTFLLINIIKQKPLGVFNLGLGMGFSVKQIAESLILGYDKGKFIGSDDFELDQQFIVDTTKLYNSLSIFPEYIKYENKIINIGNQLNLVKGKL